MKKRQEVSLYIILWCDEGTSRICVTYPDCTATEALNQAKQIGREGYVWQTEGLPSKYEYYPPSSIKKIEWVFED